MSQETKDPTIPLTELGTPVDPRYEDQLRLEFSELLSWQNTQSFPGSQPVSFEKQHLGWLEKEDYLVCEKSDGVRYLMYLKVTSKGPATFLVDRKFKFRFVDMFFPTFDNPKSSHNSTILDGELIMHTEDTMRIRKFLVFDLLYCQGQNLMERPFTKRLAYCEERVVKPYLNMLKSRPELRQTLPFIIQMKKMYKSYGMLDVFNDIPKLGYENDGLIFTPVNCPYKLATCHRLLKWKPAEMNTVDFKMLIDRDANGKPRYPLYIGSGGAYELYDYLIPDEATLKIWTENRPDGRILECRYDPYLEVRVENSSDSSSSEKKLGGWRFIRFRNDKLTPNEKSVVSKILKSIGDNVTKEQLIESCDIIKTNWKRRETSAAPNSASKPACEPPSYQEKVDVISSKRKHEDLEQGELLEDEVDGLNSKSKREDF